MAKKKHHHEEHPDERWLITYADVLTLMFVLFMVLFSISVVNTSKFELLKESLANGFNSGAPVLAGGDSVLQQSSLDRVAPIVDGLPQRIAPEVPSLSSGASLVQGTPEQALETRQLESVKSRIDAETKRSGLQDRVDTTVNERGLSIRLLTDGVLFDSGQAVLKPRGRTLLTPIVRGTRGLGNPVRVEGHTDSAPIATAQFPNNWFLGGARAAAVVSFMEGSGIASERLQNVGFADTRPVATNATPAGRSKNRRVEILVLRLQGAPGQGPAEALGGTP